MARHMPELEAFFHYRNLDVSTLKILMQRWKPELEAGFIKTGTHLALDEMTLKSFSAAAGARPRGEGHPRVGIVVTDGKSDSKSATVEAAKRAHQADITMFAVGMCGVTCDHTQNELQQRKAKYTVLVIYCASYPIATHATLMHNK